jgi:hypothetical protein
MLQDVIYSHYYIHQKVMMSQHFNSGQSAAARKMVSISKLRVLGAQAENYTHKKRQRFCVYDFKLAIQRLASVPLIFARPARWFWRHQLPSHSINSIAVPTL